LNSPAKIIAREIKEGAEISQRALSSHVPNKLLKRLRKVLG
jgi:hypothetical protein